MSTDGEVLARIDAAFGALPKPVHFTDDTHCEECAEHDELLRQRDRQTLILQDVGHPGWDPLCLSSPEGIAYYLPALARLALAKPDYAFSWHGEQRLFRLHSGAAHNLFYRHCSAQQRQAVAALLQHLIMTQAGAIEFALGEDEFLRAHALLSSPAA